ncbi:MFS transporter [Streptomyces sp. TLI_171]|uniref:MFS transporter n=1 Tax=Streptomyces sp. TLI_171 TaxID=1938859 RepID=UPI000C1878E7|nr:MFS transporter [Streptomyces sp. TLI_171]RKE19870.1 DHA2 family methylenomycin A resistance protein-like MFS transporter [Streptomyces sp. TLI_171]
MPLLDRSPAFAAALAPGRAAGRRLPLLPLVALSLAHFLVMLDVTVVNVALPGVRSSLGVGPAGLQWIVDGYSTVFAGLLLFGGGLGDRFGHRRLYLAGLAVFAAASAGCAAAPTGAVLIAARLVQGAGAALLVPASFALLRAAYPDPALRVRAVGGWGLVSAVAFGAGPAVGGLLVTGLDWRWVFWVNLPVAAAAALLTLRHLRPSRRMDEGARRSDPAGQLSGAVGLVALVGGVNQAGASGWGAPVVTALLGLGAAALTAFALVERRLERARRTRPGGRAPLLPPALLRDGRLAAANAVGLLISLGYYGMLFLVTLHLQQERHYGALGAGLALLPSVGMGLLAAPLSSRLSARLGPYRTMAGALLLGSVGFLGWLAVEPQTPYAVLLFALVTTGLATPLTVVAGTVALLEAAPAGAAGTVSALFNVSRQSGSALGVALFGALTGALGPVPGLHAAALVASAAFLLGAALAAAAARRGPHQA